MIWAKFLIRQTGALVGLSAAVLVIAFAIIHLIPGDPARRIAGREADPAAVERIREELGLDQPLHVQFLDYVGRTARLDLGSSFVTGQPVSQIIAERLPWTARLAVVAVIIVLALSVPIGIAVGALTRDGRKPRLSMAFTAATGIGGAIPEFLAGTVLAFVLAVWLRLLPVAGTTGLAAVALPALSMSIRPIALLSRIVRAETVEVLAQDYIRTARSKRLPTARLYVRHVLPNVLTAALTVGGLLLAGLLGGAVIVENVFAWPGLGTAAVQAVLARDYPVVQGIVLVLGVAVVTVNTAVNIAIGLVDPRSLLRA